MGIVKILPVTSTAVYVLWFYAIFFGEHYLLLLLLFFLSQRYLDAATGAIISLHQEIMCVCHT